MLLQFYIHYIKYSESTNYESTNTNCLYKINYIYTYIIK